MRALRADKTRIFKPQSAFVLQGGMRRFNDGIVMHDEIQQVEARLRVAMLISDVAELDALLDDRLMFIGPNGEVCRKEDDLNLYRTCTTRFTHVDFEEVLIKLHGSTAVVVVLANLAGVFKGKNFQGRNRYARTWIRSGKKWRIIAGSVCALPLELTDIT